MHELAVVLHRVGTVLCLGAFALSFMSAMAAGADPLEAMVRSVAGTAGLAVLFVVVCRATVSVFGAGESMTRETVPVEEAEG